MPDNYITFEDGQIKLDDVLLPGIFKAQSISGGVKFDDVKDETKSGSNKIAKGWNDAEITFSTVLTCEAGSTCNDKLLTINSIFKSSDSNAKPKIYRIVSTMTISMGVSTVLFASIDTSKNNEIDTIDVTMKFTEHEPYQQVLENRNNGSGSGSSGDVTTSDPGTEITRDEPSAFMQGLNDGSSLFG